MKNFKMKVTTLVIVALIVGLGGLSFLTYYKTRALLTTDLEMHISSLTLSAGSEVGLWLDTHKAEMEIMANTPLLQSGDTNAIISYINKEIQRNKKYEEFIVADNQGNFFSNSGKMGSFEDCDYFNEVMATGNTVISDPLVAIESGSEIIVVAAPIRKGSKVVGLIGGTVKITELTQIVTSKKVEESGYAFMVQKNGLTIIKPNQEFITKYNALKTDNISPNFNDAIQKMIRWETGVTKYSYLNEDNYLAYAPVPGIKWSLGVVVPVTYITNQLRYLPIDFIVLTVFFGTIVAFLLSRWLVAPLTNLAKFTTKLNGNLHEKMDIYRLNSPVIEVRSLAMNFHKMLVALQESFRVLESSNANLEGEIMERTRVQENLEISYEELGAAEEELRGNFEKLQSKEEALQESERRFRSLLENIELATYIINKDGHVIFCNDFMLALTGFRRHEVIGQNFSDTFFPHELQENVNATLKDALNNKLTVFHNTYLIQTRNREKRLLSWTYTLLFDSESNVAGVAAIGDDITERKQFEERLKYMSFNDSLTDLNNRSYFEEKLRFLEENNFAPVGMIICDVDGLKLINDTLGHRTGDQLLRLTAGIIKKCFREEDLLFRIGGDEFAIILPNSELALVEQACHRIRRAVERYNVKNEEFPLSLSVGFAVSGKENVDLAEVFKEADNGMYREKLHRSKSTRSALVQALMKALEVRDFITEGHADRLQDIVILLGKEIGLPERNLADLRLLAQFHDIGKVGIPDRILFKPGRLTNEEFKEMQRHSEIGYRIAQSAPDLRPIADQILRHHEWWNGEGYPLGLKEEEIPMECRILAIADAYDAMTSDRPYRKGMSQEEAFQELINNTGIQFDPILVPLFIKVMS